MPMYPFPVTHEELEALTALAASKAMSKANVLRAALNAYVGHPLFASRAWGKPHQTHFEREVELERQARRRDSVG